MFCNNRGTFLALSLFFVTLMLFFANNALSMGRLSAGHHYTMAVKLDGSLWGTGFNYVGQLGDGTSTSRDAFTQIGTDEDWLAVDAGYRFTFAIKEDGTLWSWGHNNYGTLGLGYSGGNVFTPQQIGNDSNWVTASTGHWHSAGVKSDGSLWAWGSNAYGMLGDPTIGSPSVPTQIGTSYDWIDVVAANHFTVGLKSDGTIWTWGNNYGGSLGIGEPDGVYTTPRKVSGEDWAYIGNISTPHELTCYVVAIKNNGTLWSWGTNNMAQLGVGDLLSRNSPTQIGQDGDWVHVSSGHSHSLAVKEDGSLWAWGWGSYGQLGVCGYPYLVKNPIPTGSFTVWPIVAAGSHHSVGINGEGLLHTWGNNNVGQLGDGTTIRRPCPTLVGDFGVKPPIDPPLVNAGDNIEITTEEQEATTILGMVSHPDLSSIAIYYRWMEGEVELTSWLPVNQDGSSTLFLSSVPVLNIGEHYLKLEVSIEGIEEIWEDQMILSVGNSSPVVALQGGGVYEVNTAVIISGGASDYDGDELNFHWFLDDQYLSSGQVLSTLGGDPVSISPLELVGLTLGIHTLRIELDDGVNPSILEDVIVNIVDTTAPIIQPIPNTSILWPPNHQMVDISIAANVMDNSGAVTLSAQVSSNEPENGLGDGDMYPDWFGVTVNPDTHIVEMELRAERGGGGNGRTYYVILIASDESGNSSEVVLDIKVPHSKGKAN